MAAQLLIDGAFDAHGADIIRQPELKRDLFLIGRLVVTGEVPEQMGRGIGPGISPDRLHFQSEAGQRAERSAKSATCWTVRSRRRGKGRERRLS